MNNLDMIRSGKGIPPIGFGIGMMESATVKEKPNTTKPRKLTVNVSVKNTKEFQLLINIFTKMVTDERLDKNIRQSYLEEFIENSR